MPSSMGRVRVCVCVDGGIETYQYLCAIQCVCVCVCVCVPVCVVRINAYVRVCASNFAPVSLHVCIVWVWPQ